MKRSITILIAAATILFGGGVLLTATLRSEPLKFSTSTSGIGTIGAGSRTTAASVSSEPVTSSERLETSSESASPASNSNASPPALGSLLVTPNMIGINTPTQVMVSISIADPRLISNSVNLLQLNAIGGQPTDLGTLPCNASGTCSAEFIFSQQSAGQIQLEVSAAFQGALRRVLSTPVPLYALSSFSSGSLGIQFLIPPSMIIDPATTNSEGSSLYIHPPTDEYANGGITVNVFNIGLPQLLDQIATTLTLTAQTTQVFNGQTWTINQYTDPNSGQDFVDAFSVSGGRVYEIGGMANGSTTTLLYSVLGTVHFL